MFDGYIRDHARWTPRAPAVVWSRGVASFAAFDADIDRFARGLAGRGLTPATGVVSVCVDDPYLACVLTVALARLRIPSGPFNDWGAALRLIDRAGAGDDAPGPELIMLDRDWVATTRAAPADPVPAADVEPEALGRVILSSGTTRRARRVAFSWRRIETGNLTHVRTYAAGAQGLFAPMTTIDSSLGFTMALAAWSLGAAVGPGLTVRELAMLLEAREEGVITCTPAQLRNLLGVLPEGFEPRTGWRLLTAGALLPIVMAQEARLRITPHVGLIYGSTESSLIAIGPASEPEDDPGQTGIVPAGSILEIVDDEGRPVPEGGSGEIRVASQRATLGYMEDPEATSERFAGDWFLTRDVGRRLPDGRIVLEGRVDERMNLGGIKFMPRVLEDAAGACPGVLDCAAFAVPDGAGQDQCWLAVVVAPGFDRDALAPFLAARPERLPPPRFAWTDEIPRNTMGKVERNRLREAVQAAIRPA